MHDTSYVLLSLKQNKINKERKNDQEKDSLERYSVCLVCCSIIILIGSGFFISVSMEILAVIAASKWGLFLVPEVSG